MPPKDKNAAAVKKPAAAPALKKGTTLGKLPEVIPIVAKKKKPDFDPFNGMQEEMTELEQLRHLAGSSEVMADFVVDHLLQRTVD